MNIDPNHCFNSLPWNLQDVILRIWNCQTVFGFELELLADHVSR